MAQLQIAELFRDIQFKLAENPAPEVGESLFIRFNGEAHQARQVSLHDTPFYLGSKPAAEPALA